MWTCPSCGLDGVEDNSVRCPGCGFSRKSYPCLSGSNGEFVLKTSLVFGRKNLAKLVGEDGVYAEDKQFEIRPSSDDWNIVACDVTRNATMLNEEEIALDEKAIKDGDAISIASRKDTSVRKAIIHVSFKS